MHSMRDIYGSHFWAEDVERPNEKIVIGICRKTAFVIIAHNDHLLTRPSLTTNPNLDQRTIRKSVVFKTQPIFAKAVLPRFAKGEPPPAIPGTKSFGMKAMAWRPIPRAVRRME